MNVSATEEAPASIGIWAGFAAMALGMFMATVPTVLPSRSAIFLSSIDFSAAITVDSEA